MELAAGDALTAGPSIRRRNNKTDHVDDSGPISFKQLDLYPKLQEDFKVKTSGGGTGMFSALCCQPPPVVDLLALCSPP